MIINRFCDSTLCWSALTGLEKMQISWQACRDFPWTASWKWLSLCDITKRVFFNFALRSLIITAFTWINLDRFSQPAAIHIQFTNSCITAVYNTTTWYAKLRFWRSEKSANFHAKSFSNPCLKFILVGTLNLKSFFITFIVVPVLSLRKMLGTWYGPVGTRFIWF